MLHVRNAGYLSFWVSGRFVWFSLESHEIVNFAETSIVASVEKLIWLIHLEAVESLYDAPKLSLQL